MLQQILVLTAFLAAMFYMGRMVYNNFFSKKIHCPGCSGCSTIDFEGIEKQMEEKHKI